VIFAIDPGTTKSAFAILDKRLYPVKFGIVQNERLIDGIEIYADNETEFVIEMVESYGMAVGKEVFETVAWIGRFVQAAIGNGATKVNRISRKAVKVNLCNSVKAKDANIRQALIDRFGEVGTKKNRGWFYGVSKDVWAAIALGVTHSDICEIPFYDPEPHKPTQEELDDLFRCERGEGDLCD